ncbi:MAG: FliG C-terminal domain-containing protein [Elusimicrobiota bacterium]
MSYKLNLCCGAVLLALAGAAAAAVTPKEASRELEAKVALESSLEKRLQAVLREALGTDDLIVIVNVALKSETEHDDSEVMPGVPPKDAQAADPMAGAAGMSMPMVNRISATLIVDQDTEAKDVELVKKVAAGILGISAGRGDSLNVEKIKFHKPRPAPDTQRYFTLGSSALWLLFAVIALAVLQRKFLGPLITNLRDLSAAALMRKGGEERAPAAEREAAAAAGAPGSGPAPHAAEGRAGLPFSFLDRGDLPKLIHLLRGSTEEVAATVVQYLPPDVAGKVLAALEPDARRQVVSLLSRVNELVESQVRPLEESVRQRIDYMIGGEDKLVELLETLPADIQSDLLLTLRGDDPEIAENVSRRIVFIEDIAALEPAEIKLLSRRVPAKLLAVLLKSSAVLRLNVLPKLATGTREWLTQEIELSSDPTPEALEAARQPVLAALAQLVREGRIVLRKKSPEPDVRPSDAVPQEA